MTKVRFILFSISNGWIFWSANHTSIFENSKLNVFNGVRFFVAISNKLAKGLLGTNVYKTLESCW